MTAPVPSSSAGAASAPPSLTAWPALALLFNALVWGLSWWPFRHLQGLGLHPLWTTAVIYALAVGVLSVWRPLAWRELLQHRPLWLLALASGCTNAAFNWGVTLGDVVRVVLLFYLMPVWAALLARWLLRERWTAGTAWRTLAALLGAALVLWPAAAVQGVGSGAGAHAIQASAWGLADALGLLGGMAFALNNVLVRREAQRSEGARALAMMVGGALIAAGLGLALAGVGATVGTPSGTHMSTQTSTHVGAQVASPPSATVTLPTTHNVGQWLPGALALGLCFLAANLALQHGAARLSAQTTAVLMTTEVLFASASAVALGESALSWRLLMGAALILGASLAAAWR